MTTTTTILATRKRYESATEGIEALAFINHEGDVAGRLVIKSRANSGGHTVRAFLHFFGYPMVEGVANGGGYDMASAAVQDALSKAWPALAVHERARLEPMAKALESASVDSAAFKCVGVRFVRAI